VEPEHQASAACSSVLPLGKIGFKPRKLRKKIVQAKTRIQVDLACIFLLFSKKLLCLQTRCTGQISFMNEFSLYKDASKLFFINNLYKKYRLNAISRLIKPVQDTKTFSS
jgi:hypothetical protein